MFLIFYQTPFNSRFIDTNFVIIQEELEAYKRAVRASLDEDNEHERVEVRFRALFYSDCVDTGTCNSLHHHMRLCKICALLDVETIL
jgi:hypothetical protein